MSSITICVPATTSNLGPGFDCLGLALALWNQASFSIEGDDVRVEIAGFGAESLPRNLSNLVLQSFFRLYERVGEPRPAGLRLHCENRFPTGSGLGSSASAVLMGLMGANALLGQPFSGGEILSLATEIEGHPDNVTPASMGGLTLSAVRDGGVIARKIDIAPVTVVIVVPEFELSTQAARAALPKQVSMTDAVFNIGRTALVVEALREGDFALLEDAMDDRLHQPHRLGLIPGAAEAFESARQAGAGAVALSGAGPGVVAFVEGRDLGQRVAGAMAGAFTSAGVGCWQCVTGVSETGASVECTD
ncbi:MAG: homoserine kinase [Anaerolineales bacterium]